MKTKENISNQDRATIITLNPNPVARAFIYGGEQRAKIVQAYKSWLSSAPYERRKGAIWQKALASRKIQR